jgi:hypothetical protein
VTLTAVPAAHYSLRQWGGDCASAGANPTCTLSMSDNRSAVAVAQINSRLSVSITGQGRVTGPQIDCPSTCTADYPPDTSVTLHAAPSANNFFAGWNIGSVGAGTTQTVIQVNGPVSLQRNTLNGRTLVLSIPCPTCSFGSTSETKTISSNTENTITVSSPFTRPPSNQVIFITGDLALNLPRDLSVTAQFDPVPQ